MQVMCQNRADAVSIDPVPVPFWHVYRDGTLTNYLIQGSSGRQWEHYVYMSSFPPFTDKHIQKRKAN